MSFLEQPEEIIIEQLRHLNPEEILNVCQTDLRLSQICRGRRLWEILIHDRAPDLDLSQVQNPRSFFFRAFVYGGGIYLNFVLQPYELERATEIAESTGFPYLMIYSRSVPDPAGFKLDLISVQTPEYTELLKPDQEITEVDILTPGNDYDKLISLSKALRTTISTIRRSRDAILQAANKYLYNTIINSIEKIIKSGHQNNQTPLYRVTNPRRRSLVPPFRASEIGDLEERKERKESMINFLIAEISAEHAKSLGYESYQEFVDTQRTFVHNMNGEQLQTLEFARDKLVPSSRTFNFDTLQGHDIYSLALGKDGKIIFFVN